MFGLFSSHNTSRLSRPVRVSFSVIAENKASTRFIPAQAGPPSFPLFSPVRGGGVSECEQSSQHYIGDVYPDGILLFLRLLIFGRFRLPALRSLSTLFGFFAIRRILHDQIHGRQR